MQAVHETGHVLAAWQTGAKVERVILHPLTFSRTDTIENPHPLFVCWSGAVFGILFPLSLALIGFIFDLPYRHLFRFFAGFCCVANGAYLGFDFSEIGPTDAGLLMEHGAKRYQLVVFGIVSIALGLFLWHGQAKCFGFGRETDPVSWKTALTVFVLLFVVVIFEIMGYNFT
jgi:hypothetical protein